MNNAAALIIMDDEKQAEPVHTYADNVVTLGVTSSTQLCRQSPNEKDIAMVGDDMNNRGVTTGDDNNSAIAKDKISVDKFIELLSQSGKEVSLRTAQRILKAGSEFKKWNWNGEEVELKVERIASETGGGNKGTTYIVVASSLPMDLQKKWYAQFIQKIEVPVEKTVSEKAINLRHAKEQIQKRTEEGNWKSVLLAPILAAPKGSSLRKQLIDELHGSTIWDSAKGKEITLKASTIRYWVRKVEEQGTVGLCRKIRTDAGKKYCYISKKWDKAMRGYIEIGLEISEQQLKQAENYIYDFVRGSLKGGLSQSKTVELAGFELIKHTIALLKQVDCELTIEQACEFCMVTENLVRTVSKEGWKAAYLKVHDAKTYYDNYLPSIQRYIHDLLPNQLVMGDVHKMDTPVERDGKAYFPSAIAWMDVATVRVRIDIVFSEQGKGVTQVDVITSYMKTVQEWGFIHTLYLDNGSEYRNSDWIRGIQNLHEMTGQIIDIKAQVPKEMRELYKPVIREAVYNAKGKGVEEGFFANWEYNFMAWRKEHAGGLRMDMKLPALGAKPLTVDDRNEYEQWTDETLAIYHTTQQNGRLNGLSPNEKLNEFINNGWKKIAITWQALELAFAKPVDKGLIAGSTGKAGTFKVNNQVYFSSLFSRLTGIRHEALIPLQTQAYIYVADNITKKAVQVMLDNGYSHFGHEGSTESRRRKAEANAIVDQMIENAPDVNVHAAMLEMSVHKEQAKTPETKTTVDVDIVEADVKHITQQTSKPTRYGVIDDDDNDAEFF